LAPCSARFPYTTLFRSEVHVTERGRGWRQWHRLRGVRHDSRWKQPVDVTKSVDCQVRREHAVVDLAYRADGLVAMRIGLLLDGRSEEHTSELQSRVDVV